MNKTKLASNPLRKFSLAASVFVGLVFFFFIGCKKADLQTTTTQTPQTSAKTQTEGTAWSVANERVTSFRSDEEGNPLSADQISKPKKKPTGGVSLLSTTCDDWDPGMASATFKGSSASIICTQLPDNLVTITFYYDLATPSAPTVSASNVGRVRVSAGIWPTFPVAKTFTVTPTITYQTGEDYYDAVFDATMMKYKVAFSITMKYSEYCGYVSYKSNFTIVYDCVNMGTATTAYQTDPQYFTPSGYQALTYQADPYTGHQIKFWPPVILCTHQCHFPSSGTSSKHQVQYRLNGTSTWTTVTYTDLADHYVTVTTGTYQFRSRGVIVASPETYGEYSGINTVVVP